MSADVVADLNTATISFRSADGDKSVIETRVIDAGFVRCLAVAHVPLVQGAAQLLRMVLVSYRATPRRPWVS